MCVSINCPQYYVSIMFWVFSIYCVLNVFYLLWFECFWSIVFWVFFCLLYFKSWVSYVCCVFNVLYLLCIQCCQSCEAQHKIKFKKMNKMLSLVFVTWILESCILIHYLGSPLRLKYYIIYNQFLKIWSTTMTITSLRFCCLEISKHVKCACPPKCKELVFERFSKPKPFFFPKGVYQIPW